MFLLANTNARCAAPGFFLGTATKALQALVTVVGPCALETALLAGAGWSYAKRIEMPVPGSVGARGIEQQHTFGRIEDSSLGVSVG